MVEATIETSQPSEVAKTAKFVTAAPLDVEQIASFSKKSLANTQDQVKIFAPFDAVVINNGERVATTFLVQYR